MPESFLSKYSCVIEEEFADKERCVCVCRCVCVAVCVEEADVLDFQIFDVSL